MSTRQWTLSDIQGQLVVGSQDGIWIVKHCNGTLVCEFPRHHTDQSIIRIYAKVAKTNDIVVELDMVIFGVAEPKLPSGKDGWHNNIFTRVDSPVMRTSKHVIPTLPETIEIQCREVKVVQVYQSGNALLNISMTPGVGGIALA